ncbi:uncharacterized protein BDZ99DRAFT_528133 [Mytilinidion resinicola]|uniref:Uncharacterized protein n=1 Tax=Mytilinidion resinicola TaxID=574789 RepID=A0A6A6XZ26_9PEZI|nr:uncharacterized protein BDZ99DRAFT_528133 [Mytilinidion resinicola]KAF2801660.1 hypothetical protein BDZ99DRAFT_528133 [Mytilinidion resinicola]
MSFNNSKDLSIGLTPPSSAARLHTRAVLLTYCLDPQAAAGASKDDPFARHLNPFMPKRADTGAQLSTLNNRMRGLAMDLYLKEEEVRLLRENVARLSDPERASEAEIIASKDADIAALHQELWRANQKNESTDRTARLQREHIQVLQRDLNKWKNVGDVEALQVALEQKNEELTEVCADLEAFKFERTHDKQTIKTHAEQIEQQKQEMNHQAAVIEAHQQEMQRRDAEAVEKIQQLEEQLKQAASEAGQYIAKLEQDLKHRAPDSETMKKLTDAQVQIGKLRASATLAERNLGNIVRSKLVGAVFLRRPDPSTILTEEVLCCYNCWARNEQCDNKVVCRRCADNRVPCRRWRCAASVVGETVCPRVNCPHNHDWNGWLKAEVKRPVWWLQGAIRRVKMVLWWV